MQIILLLLARILMLLGIDLTMRMAINANTHIAILALIGLTDLMFIVPLAVLGWYALHLVRGRPGIIITAVIDTVWTILVWGSYIHYQYLSHLPKLGELGEATDPAVAGVISHTITTNAPSILLVLVPVLDGDAAGQVAVEDAVVL